MQAELGACQRQSDTGTTKALDNVQRSIESLKNNLDFALLRGKRGMASLSRVARQSWQALWTDFDSLLQEVRQPRSRGLKTPSAEVRLAD
jgi:hypothetical protein